MPFTSEEILEAGKIGLDHYLKNNPVDQINIEHPVFQKFNSMAKSFPGAKENVVEQLHITNSSNFQWFNGATVVTYNKRRTVSQASFPWRSAHDGFALDEDRLLQNGISVIEGRGGQFDTSPNPGSEAARLTNLVEEQSMSLKEGFIEKMEQALLQDGTQDADAIVGLDALVDPSPATGTVGGINAATAGNEYWRNNAVASLTTTTTTGTIVTNMESQWRACVRRAKSAPNFIIAGSSFIDGYRDFVRTTYGQGNFDLSSSTSIEGGVSGTGMAQSTGLTFKGVPIIWVPAFSDLDTLLSPTPLWEKRCYFLNMRHIKLRPIENQNMVTRKPPRAYDRYEYYWGLTWRGAMTINHRAAHSVMSIS